MEITPLLNELLNAGSTAIGELNKEKKSVPIISTEEARKKSIDTKEKKQESKPTKQKVKKLLKTSSTKNKDDEKEKTSKKPKAKEEKKKTTKKKAKKDEDTEKKEKKETPKNKKVEEKKKPDQKKAIDLGDKEKEVKRDITKTKIEEKKDTSETTEKSKEEKKPKKNEKKTKIVLSGFDPATSTIKKKLKDLGLFHIQTQLDDATLVVVHKSMRTEKVLDAIVKGIPVVNEQYVDKCVEEEREVEVEDYLLTEAFPALSVTSKQRNSLFADLSLCFVGQTKIPVPVLSRWVEKLGGVVKLRVKDADVIVCGKLKSQNTLSSKKNDKVELVTETWVYDSLEKMAIMDYSRYRVEVANNEQENEDEN